MVKINYTNLQHMAKRSLLNAGAKTIHEVELDEFYVAFIIPEESDQKPTIFQYFNFDKDSSGSYLDILRRDQEMSGVLFLPVNKK